jgi:hypothetical protein
LRPALSPPIASFPRRLLRRFRRSCKGSAVVEFALVAPVFFPIRHPNGETVGAGARVPTNVALHAAKLKRAAPKARPFCKHFNVQQSLSKGLH